MTEAGTPVSERASPEAEDVASVHAGLEAAGWRRMPDEGFIELVGPFWQHTVDKGRFCFLAEPRHHNRRGIVQGGMLVTFADRSLGTTVRSVNTDRPQATLQLDVHFIDAAFIGEVIESRCRVFRRTKSLVFVDAEIMVGERMVATVKGIWKIMSADAPNYLENKTSATSLAPQSGAPQSGAKGS